MSRMWEIRENYGERNKDYSDTEMDAYEAGYEEGYAAAMKEVKGGGYGERSYGMRGGYGQRDEMAGAGGDYGMRGGMGYRDDRYYGERHRDSMGRFRR